MTFEIGTMDGYTGLLCQLKSSKALRVGYRLEKSIDLTPFKSIKIGWRCNRDWPSTAQATTIRFCLIGQDKKKRIMESGTIMRGDRWIQHYSERDITDINEYAFFSFSCRWKSGSSQTHLITSVEFIKK